MRRPDFLKRAAALWCGRRDGTGPPPPASTVLRIALTRDGLRPPLTPETSGGPQGQQSGQAPRGCPGQQRRPPAPRAAQPLAGLTPAARTEGHWNTSATTGHKRTLVRLRQQAENYKADRRSATKLSLNQSRGAPILTAIDELLDHHTSGQIAAILNNRGLHSGTGEPFHGKIIDNIIRAYRVRTRRHRLRSQGMLTLAETAAAHGVANNTIKAWRRAGIVSAQRYNDKGEYLYNPPDPASPPNRPKIGRRPKNP
jgi:hypothetical protein